MIKLRPSVHFAPLDNGVFFKNWDRSFRLSGHPALYPIFERLLPHLERGVARDALVAAVPAGAQAAVKTLLDQLGEYGMVVELSSADQAALSAADAEACASTLAWLEGVAVHPHAAFHRLRAARVALIGAGVAQLAAARAIAGMHVGALVCCPPPTDDDDGALAAAGSDPWTLVVHVQDHLDVATLRQVAARVTAPLLQAVVGADAGVIGPLRDGGRGGIDDALARWRPPAQRDPGRAASPLMAGLLGNLVALEAVKFVAGLAASTQDGHCAIVTGAPLAASFHPILARASGPPTTEAAARAVTAARGHAALSRAALVEALQGVADPQVGLIRLPHPDDLPQLPVFTQLAVAGDRIVVGHGHLIEDAVAQAGLEAIRALAQAGAPARVPMVTPSGDPRGEVATAQAHLSVATGYTAWLTAGLLGHLCDRLADPVRPELAAVIAELPLEAGAELTPQARLHIRTLTARFGRRIALDHVTLPALPGLHIAVVRIDGEVAGLHAGFVSSAAVETALLEAVARVQLATCGRSLPSRSPLPALAVDDLAPAARAGTGSLEELLAQLAALGCEVVVHPWCDEPALAGLGILVGWVAIHVR